MNPHKIIIRATPFIITTSGKRIARAPFLIPLLLLALALASVRTARATDELELISGGDTVYVPDTSGSGTISYEGVVGTYSVIITFANTYPAVGSLSMPSMLINTSQGPSGTGDLSVIYSATGFGPTDSPFAVSLSGVSNGPGVTVAYNLYDDTANDTLFAETNLIEGIGPTSPTSSFDLTGTSGTDSIPSPYSLTEDLEIAQTSGNVTGITASAMAIPEPASVGLLLAAASTGAIALLRRRGGFGSRRARM